MSEPIIERPRRAYEARNRGDFDAGSGIEIEIDSFGVWTFDENGLMIRLEGYLEHEEAKARQAAGL